MNKASTFILGIFLGLIFGVGLVLYFISPRGTAAPKGTPIQPPVGTTAGTAVIQLKQEFFTPVIQTVLNQENPPSFPLSLTNQPVEQPVGEITCGKITFKPEGGGTVTSVKMDNGKILIPIAFTGNINAFGTCFEFSGSAESDLELRFDENQQIVFGQVNVRTVNLEGVSPLVSGLLTPLVQSTINQRFNPVEILRGDQITVKIPVKSTGSILLGKVKDVRAEIKDNSLFLFITYDFSSQAQEAGSGER